MSDFKTLESVDTDGVFTDSKETYFFTFPPVFLYDPSFNPERQRYARKAAYEFVNISNMETEVSLYLNTKAIIGMICVR